MYMNFKRVIIVIITMGAWNEARGATIHPSENGTAYGETVLK